MEEVVTGYYPLVYHVFLDNLGVGVGENGVCYLHQLLTGQRCKEILYILCTLRGVGLVACLCLCHFLLDFKTAVPLFRFGGLVGYYEFFNDFKSSGLMTTSAYPQ